MIMLTERAAKKVKEIAEEEGLKPMIRLKILGGGCSSFTNDILFIDAPTDLDEISELDGVQLVIDPFSYCYLDESGVDYLEGEFESGFKITGPAIKASCGCGKSFSF